jgi:antitoxin VapB
MANNGGKTIIQLAAKGDAKILRIPPELWFEENPEVVEIERSGDVLIVRPLPARKLTGIAELVARFSDGFMAGEREFHEER